MENKRTNDIQKLYLGIENFAENSLCAVYFMFKIICWDLTVGNVAGNTFRWADDAFSLFNGIDIDR